MDIQEAFEAALQRHYDDGNKGELLLGYDPTLSTPWFLVEDDHPMDVVGYGKTAVQVLETYAREGAQ